MFVQCSKRFENLYYIISIRAFQKPMSEYAHQILKYKIPNLRLHLRLRLRGAKFFHLRLRLRLQPKKITFGRPLVLETLYFAKMSLTHDSFRWNNEIKVWPNDSKHKFKFDQRINLEIWMVLLRLPSKNKKKPWVRLIWLITH